jgi:hypothetical protein
MIQHISRIAVFRLRLDSTSSSANQPQKRGMDEGISG